MENGRNCLRNTPEQIPQKELGPPEHRGRPPPLNALTEPQRQFAEEHHALIYQFLLDRRLDICEYYDIAALGYLRCAEVPDAARLVPILFFHGRVEGYGAESWRFLSG